MSADALVQARINADVRDRAATVLEGMGLTISDAVRILLTRTAEEGAPPIELLMEKEAHNAWFRGKVLEALTDDRPDVLHTEVEQHFASRRDAAGKAKRS